MCAATDKLASTTVRPRNTRGSETASRCRASEACGAETEAGAYHCISCITAFTAVFSLGQLFNAAVPHACRGHKICHLATSAAPTIAAGAFEHQPENCRQFCCRCRWLSSCLACAYASPAVSNRVSSRSPRSRQSLQPSPLVEQLLGLRLRLQQRLAGVLLH